MRRQAARGIDPQKGEKHCGHQRVCRGDDHGRDESGFRFGGDEHVESFRFWGSGPNDSSKNHRDLTLPKKEAPNR